MKLDELIEALQKIRNENGNIRVVTVNEYNETQNVNACNINVGYDNCQEFMNYEDLGDPEFNPEMVLGIKVN